MNIFAYSPDIHECVQWLDDTRSNKMMIETAQLLCTRGRWEFGTEFTDSDTYKSTHVSHPCSIWLRQSWGNYLWLANYWTELSKLWPSHMSYAKNIDYVRRVMDNVDIAQPMTPFANCARSKDLGLDFTHLPVHDAYRQYHCARWDMDKRKPTWKRGTKPDWY